MPVTSDEVGAEGSGGAARVNFAENIPDPNDGVPKLRHSISTRRHSFDSSSGGSRKSFSSRKLGGGGAEDFLAKIHIDGPRLSDTSNFPNDPAPVEVLTHRRRSGSLPTGNLAQLGLGLPESRAIMRSPRLLTRKIELPLAGMGPRTRRQSSLKTELGYMITPLLPFSQVKKDSSVGFSKPSENKDKDKEMSTTLEEKGEPKQEEEKATGAKGIEKARSFESVSTSVSRVSKEETEGEPEIRAKKVTFDEYPRVKHFFSTAMLKGLDYVMNKLFGCFDGGYVEEVELKEPPPLEYSILKTRVPEMELRKWRQRQAQIALYNAVCISILEVGFRVIKYSRRSQPTQIWLRAIDDFLFWWRIDNRQTMKGRIKTTLKSRMSAALKSNKGVSRRESHIHRNSERFSLIVQEDRIPDLPENFVDLARDSIMSISSRNSRASRHDGHDDEEYSDSDNGERERVGHSLSNYKHQRKGSISGLPANFSFTDLNQVKDTLSQAPATPTNKARLQPTPPRLSVSNAIESDGNVRFGISPANVRPSLLEEVPPESPSSNGSSQSWAAASGNPCGTPQTTQPSPGALMWLHSAKNTTNHGASITVQSWGMSSSRLLRGADVGISQEEPPPVPDRSVMRTMSLTDIVFLGYGPYSECFENYMAIEGALPWLCVVIHFADEHQIPLVCPNERSTDYLLMAMQALSPLGNENMSRGRIIWERVIMKLNHYGIKTVQEAVNNDTVLSSENPPFEHMKEVAKLNKINVTPIVVRGLMDEEEDDEGF